MVELKTTESNNVEPILVSYLLVKEGIPLPIALMKHEFIIKIEKSLRNGSPLILSKTFEELAKNLERVLRLDILDILLKIIKEFKERDNFYISKDDEKIIDYIVKLDKFKLEFLLETIGPLYFLLRTFEEIKKINQIPKTIEFFIILHSYVFLYELILYQIDRRLYHNLKPEEHINKKWYNNFFKKVDRKNYRNHATAGLINEIFSDILILPKENDSIFGGKSEVKIFRNKVAHANVFYDEEGEEIVIVSNRYRVDEFLKLFFRLFSFLIKWFEKSSGVESEDLDSFKNKIISCSRNIYNELSKELLKIERSGELKIRFMNLVISLKKEAGLP